MAYSAFGINYDTAAKIGAYGGDASVPAQPIWAEDTHQLWIVHGTQGKYRIAMVSELSSYLTTANASATYLTKTDAGKTYLTQAAASTTYLGINAKAKTACAADTATDAVKKSGNRAALSGYEAISSTASAVTINATSLDDQVVTGAVTITISDGAAGQTWQKNVVVKNPGVVVAPGSKWKWIGGSAPEMKAPSLLVCKWAEDVGFLNLAVTE